MKKFIYTVLFAAIISITISSCTEEDVAPTNTELSNGGGTAKTGDL